MRCSRVSALQRSWRSVSLCLLFLALEGRALPHRATARSLPPSGVQCPSDDRSETRLCEFSNLVLSEGRLVYITQGNSTPSIPEIMVSMGNRLEPYFAEIETQSVESLLQAGPPVVDHIPAAVFVDTLWRSNSYHNLAESLLEYHTKLCVHLGECWGSNATWLFTLHQQQPINRELTWVQEAPYMRPYSACLSPHPVVFYGHSSLSGQGRVTVIRKALIGVGTYNRRMVDVHLLPQYRALFQPPPPHVLSSYRQLLFRCVGVDIKARSRQATPLVVFVQRGDDRARHFTNLNKVVRMVQKQLKLRTRVIRPGEMSAREQVLATHEADILVQTHGAAYGNLVFMREGSVLVHYDWTEEPPSEGNWHTFAEQMLQDLNLPVLLLVTSSRDVPGNLEYIRENFIHNSAFGGLSAEQRTAFYEGQPLAGLGLSWPWGDSRYHINLSMEIPTLAYALQEAMRALDAGITKFVVRNLAAEKFAAEV